ncbi:conserved hypothetical protein [Sporisorium reilianum SRZ2]|uniref:Uncharacterized protein n=1 Tax=Sporisorium reilianum (strain SRZ2) TaxID=999809 RepID=E6ZTX1_SPORE|nr:conserved hypothetical protein [Sporisorium reilianum SRZ2]
MDLETDEDGWIGGSSQSIYARKPQPSTHTSPPPSTKPTNKPSPVTPHRKTSTSRDTNSRSLLERINMADALQQTPPPKASTDQPDSSGAANAASTPSPSSSGPVSPFRTMPSQGIRRPGAKLPSPLPLTSPARNNSSTSPLNTRTPLSASHPIPETPLKLSQRGGPQTPATPHYPAYPPCTPAHNSADTSRASGLGLGLTPLKAPVPLAPSPDNVRSPLNEALNLRGRAASNASIGSPLKARRAELHSEPLGLGSQSGSKQGVDDRVRNTRSGLGTSASMWAPKPAAADSDTASTTSHTIGSGFSSSNLLGVQTGLDRKRPSHRPNGLQLSLGQEISVMQELEENAEEEGYAASAQSSATVAGAFQINAPDNASEGDWNGTVVPPTPALGCDSPSSDHDDGAPAKAPSRSLDAFGWGSHASSEPRKTSLFGNLPSASTLEANWSGDDDDERKDDVQMFEDLQQRAKATRRTAYTPLPPPSPTHRMLAKSPQLDGARSVDRSPMLGTSPARTNGKLSPASARVSDDSDGDADAETDRPRAGTDRKPAKAAEGDQVDAVALEKKRSLKRDKSERIRGRRASQSKDKDVERVKIAEPAPTPATVSLPTSTFAAKPSRDDELARALDRVDLGKDTPDAPKPDTQHTPAATRVQSIPTVKDDLFSSPAEPKEGEKGEKEAVATTPSHAKLASFDWAADDDELDDELPDLDDWGVTLSPAKPAPAAPAPAPVAQVDNVATGANAKKAGRNGKAKPDEDKDKTWRKAPLDSKSKPKPTPDEQRKASTGKKDAALGLRIAGRAKSASLSPDPDLPPPASTPYGRWNRTHPDESKAARPRIAADLGALAKLLTPAEEGKGASGSGAHSMHAPVAAGRGKGVPASRGAGGRKRAHGGKK